MRRCPYHLEKAKFEHTQVENYWIYKCSCGEKIPRDFVEKTKIPHLTLGLVGFGGHGKTVYITSLFYLLQALQNIWDHYFCKSLDENTIRNFFGRIQAFKDGQLPESTPANFPLPSLFQFKNIPHHGEWFVSFFDTAGEVFEHPEMIAKQGRYLAHSDVVVLVLSINDSGANWPIQIERLLNTYILGVHDLLRMDLKKRQHLIVALSKADALADALPDELEAFLMEGDYRWHTAQAGRRFNEMTATSRLIEHWLAKEKKCGGFVNKAYHSFKSVEYTLISSTGVQPTDLHLPANPEPEDPKRVLDPFLWALEKVRHRSWTEGWFGK